MNDMTLEKFFPFWNKLSPEEQNTLIQSARDREYKKGSIVSGDKTQCTGLLAVISGQLRAYVITDEGKEITLYRLFERDICLFSASCMLNSIQFDIMIEALEDTKVYIIPADVYKRLMERSALVANYTNELMASRFSDVMWIMDQILSKKLDGRLAALLLEEENLAGGDTLSTTHEQLANHLGSAREVITRMLRYFQSEGIVKLTRGKIQITDRNRLEELAQDSIR